MNASSSFGDQVRAKRAGRGIVQRRRAHTAWEIAVEDALCRANYSLDPYIEFVWCGDHIWIERHEHENLTKAELDELLEKRRAEMWERVYARAAKQWRAEYEQVMAEDAAELRKAKEQCE